VSAVHELVRANPESKQIEESPSLLVKPWMQHCKPRQEPGTVRLRDYWC